MQKKYIMCFMDKHNKKCHLKIMMVIYMFKISYSVYIYSNLDMQVSLKIKIIQILKNIRKHKNLRKVRISVFGVMIKQRSFMSEVLVKSQLQIFISNAMEKNWKFQELLKMFNHQYYSLFIWLVIFSILHLD